MEFQEILAERSTAYQDIWPFVLITGAVLVVFTLIILLNDGASTGSIITLILGAFFVIGGLVIYQESDELQKTNAAILVSNIEQKYEVDDVLLDAPEANTEAENANPQNVSVVVDGSLYTFLLTQDDNTWEPTLINIPIDDESSEKVNLSAQDILKKSD